MEKFLSFELDDEFVEKYAKRKPDFGFNGLGEFVYNRTYSRLKQDGENEKWYETVRRVVEGAMSILQDHVINNQVKNISHSNINTWAKEMYALIFDFKFLPPGRMLWALGTEYVHKRKIFMPLYNCAFISTKDILPHTAYKPFTFMMDASMLGVGVGFDVKGHNKIIVNHPKKNQGIHVIEDSREGWVDSLRILLNSFFVEDAEFPDFDYSKIRGYGEKIVGFGGTASGADPLIKLHKDIYDLLADNIGLGLSARLITDIMNLIGCCVIAGNVRRTAQIALGDVTEESFDDFLDFKNYKVNPERGGHGWASNNSVTLYDDTPWETVEKCIDKTLEDADIGYFWLDRCRTKGRFADPDHVYPDYDVLGTNPCGEQSLESGELCNLIETFPNRAKNADEFMNTLFYATLLGKIVTLTDLHIPESDAVQKKNRRMGISMSGIVQYIANRSMDELKTWCSRGYFTIRTADAILSDKLQVNRSIKVTSVKPSGTVSLLAGATPGVHFPHSKHYIRRVNVADSSPLLGIFNAQGFRTEKSVYSQNTSVIEFPIALDDNIRTLKEVTIFDQSDIAELMQHFWADNQVSCTITYNEGEDLKHLFKKRSKKWKSMSFLKNATGVYAQMPYEEITEEEYLIRINEINNKDFSFSYESEGELYCSNDTCEIK
jgi:adenosylcobalamin-dependent ribonucleoside-triphosphate reductase